MEHRDIRTLTFGTCRGPVARQWWSGVVLFALVGSVGCSEAEVEPRPSPPELTIDTLESSTVVVSNAPSDPDLAPVGWGVQEIARLGSADGDEGTVFGEVVSVEVGLEGTVYVLDRQASAVRAFSSEGRFLHTIGGRGEGPGELGDPVGLAVDRSGHVWVRDAGNDRYTRFDSDGEPVGTYRRSLGATVRELLPGDEGQLWEVSSLVDPSGPPRQAFETRLLLLGLRAGPDGTMDVPDTIWGPTPLDVETWEVEPVEVRPGMAYSGVEPVPFSPKTLGCGDRRGALWVGRTDRLRFTSISPDGDTTRIVERLTPDLVPVSATDLEGAIDDIVDRFGEDGRPAMREALQVDVDQVPEHLPLWEACYVDPNGRLWIRRFRPPGAEVDEGWSWEVYDSGGAYLGMMRLPFGAGPAPALSGNVLVGATESGGGVPQVVVLEVRTASPESEG